MILGCLFDINQLLFFSKTKEERKKSIEAYYTDKIYAYIIDKYIVSTNYPEKLKKSIREAIKAYSLEEINYETEEDLKFCLEYLNPDDIVEKISIKDWCKYIVNERGSLK